VSARIYVVSAKGGDVVRYVRASTVNAAIRAHYAEVYEARPASTEEIFQVAKAGALKVLDAIEKVPT